MLEYKKHCEACGNNPAPHWVLYLAQTLNYIGSTTIRKNHTKNYAKIASKNPKFIDLMVRIFDTFMGIMRVRKWSRQFKPTSTRSKVIIDAAKKNNIHIEQLYLFGQPTEGYRFLDEPGKWNDYYSLPSFDHDSSFRNVLDNKWEARKFLNTIHATQPQSKVIRTKKELLNFIKTAHRPLIIKPAQGSRGRHSHVYLYEDKDIISAFKNAKQICHYVMCEEMLIGSVYRFTTTGQKVVAVLRGDVAEIVGNGTDSLRDLLKIKNLSRPSEIFEVKVTSELVDILKRQRFKLTDIPQKNQRIALGQKIGVRYGGDAVEVTPSVHPSFIAEVERIAERIPLLTLGFDIIAVDITKPCKTQKWGIIEINTVPFIDLHHFPRTGKPVDVASKVWKAVKL